MKAFIIHGAYGNPDENWIPYLKKELENIRLEVIAPKFPTPENQSLENWMKVFSEYTDKFDDETIIVGHSIAPAFILAVLENAKLTIRAAFFVAGFASRLGNPDFDGINRTFLERKFDWNRIKKNCKKFYLIYSDNDPYVPYPKTEELSEKLGVEPILVKCAGHFNEKAGYKKFELLFKMIKKDVGR